MIHKIKLKQHASLSSMLFPIWTARADGGEQGRRVAAALVEVEWPVAGRLVVPLLTAGVGQVA